MGSSNAHKCAITSPTLGKPASIAMTLAPKLAGLSFKEIRGSTEAGARLVIISTIDRPTYSRRRNTDRARERNAA